MDKKYEVTIPGVGTAVVEAQSASKAKYKAWAHKGADLWFRRFGDFVKGSTVKRHREPAP